MKKLQMSFKCVNYKKKAKGNIRMCHPYKAPGITLMPFEKVNPISEYIIKVRILITISSDFKILIINRN